MTETFRLATPEDYPTVFDMINESYLAADTFFLSGPRLESLQEVIDAATHGSLYVMLGEEVVGSGHVGIIGCVHLVAAGENKIKMGLLTVRQSCKQRGLAHKIVGFSHGLARDAGHVAVLLSIVSVKPWLAKFYNQRFGYQVTGEAPWEECHMVLKQPCHFILMEKSL